MSEILGWFNPTRWLILALVVAALGASVVGYGYHKEQAGIEIGRKSEKAEWDADTVKNQAQALAESQTNARETLRRLERQQEAQRETDQEIERYRLAAVAADSERSRVLKRADQLVVAATRRAASNPASGSVSTPAGDAAGMLANMYRRTDSFAEVSGRYADALRRAVNQCNRDYDALSATIH
jgi:uncharacterized protein HemX